MKKNFFILLMIVSFACDDDNEPFVSYDHLYFPLQVGNTWHYVSAWENHPSMPTITSEITSTALIGNFKYYLMVSIYDYPDNSLISDTKDSTYYRIDANGFVYALKKKNDHILNPFRLEALEGENWKYSTSSSVNGKITITHIQTESINTINVEACKIYLFDIEDVYNFDEYHVLAPGIGIVKTGSTWRLGEETILKRAIIDGQEYQF